METNILLEKLSEFFKSVTASNKNWEPENVEYIKKVLANANVIQTNYEFFFFALEWFPKPIARKVCDKIFQNFSGLTVLSFSGCSDSYSSN